MKNRVIIVHCWSGYPTYCWYPETKKELTAKGFDVTTPTMPGTDEPKLDSWLSKLKEVIGDKTDNLYLVGHSIGAVTVMRYLESLPQTNKVKGVVLVAGFTDNLGFEELKNFFTKPLDLSKIESNADQFVAIHSDNDPYVDLKYSAIFEKELNAKVIIKHAMGHFSGNEDNETACLSLPDVTEAILKMTSTKKSAN